MAGSLALADVAVMGMAWPKHTHHIRLTRLIIGIGGAGAVAICLFARPAAAYRPFDGTDAAVANLNEVEIELQPAGRLQTGPQSTLVAPEVVYNYGFAERWEMVLQGQVETPLSQGGGPSSLAATAAFLKYVLQPGVLQGQSGVSIATEFGPLLPGINTDPGVGFSWAGIVSQRWDWGTAHFNVEANLTRDQHGEAFLDVILEGPSTWKVRPVVEVFYDKVWTETETRSALAGAIWQVRDDLSFDAAYRYALVNGHAVNEIRAGLTFAFKAESDKTPVRPGVTFGNWGLSR
jgi:opacity protein-like surface antigen